MAPQGSLGPWGLKANLDFPGPQAPRAPQGPQLRCPLHHRPMESTCQIGGELME